MREQNWLAVGIDFCIVVVGVFIGIQVANWNENQAEEERLRSQLVSFHTELIMARSDLDDFEDYYTARSNAARDLRRRLATEEPPLTEDELNRLAFSAILETPFVVRYRNFEELSSSGALARISDEALRGLIFRWDNQLTELRRLDDTSEQFRSTTVLTAYSSVVVSGNAIRQDERYEDFPRTNRFVFDVEAVRANLEFDNAVALRQLMSLQKIEQLSRHRAMTEELIAALEENAL